MRDARNEKQKGFSYTMMDERSRDARMTRARKRGKTRWMNGWKFQDGTGGERDLFQKLGAGSSVGGNWTDAKRGEIIKIGAKRGILTGCLPARSFLPFAAVTRARARKFMWARAYARKWTKIKRRAAESRIKAGTL